MKSRNSETLANMEGYGPSHVETPKLVTPTTVSLGDHNVKVYNDAQSVFRKISKIVRFPSYDQNLIDGDIALLHLSAPVPLSSNERIEFSLEIIFKKNPLRHDQHCLFACRC